MDPKRELTSVDLAVLVGEFDRLVDARVEKVYLYGDSLLRVKLRDRSEGRVELFIDVGESKRVHTIAPTRVRPAPDRPPQFAKTCRNRLAGATFESVEMFEFDRILEFVFDRDDGRTRLIAELFGQGNVAVTDGEYTVIDSLETVRLKSRTVVPGSRYEFPSSRVNPVTLDRSSFESVMTESDTDVVRTLATQLNLGGLYAEELCTRAGVEKTLDIDSMTEDTYDRVYTTLSRLVDDIRSGDVDPRLYLTDEDDPDSVFDVTPFPLEERDGYASEAVDGFNAALEEYFHRLERSGSADTDEPSRPDFESEIESRERIIEQQRSAIERFDERADEHRRMAELLYANYDDVDEIISTVADARAEGVSWEEIEARFQEGRDRGIETAEMITGVDSESGTVSVRIDDLEISIDTSNGVEHNADRLYTEAKRIAEKRAGAESAIAETKEELDALIERRDSWSEESDESDDEPESIDRDWLNDDSVPVRQEDHWFERFRWFETSDGYLVIGGRNADQNEELVKKYLEPGDLVFHTQAHGGAIAVLKASRPSESSKPDHEFPEATLTETATFAASYSSLWKDEHFTGDVYAVGSDQVSKSPESGEYLEKGSFAIRGDRTYYRDTPVGVAIGVVCEPDTRVIGGPPSSIVDRSVTSIEIEPGRYAQSDVAKRIYRTFKDRFADETFVRKIASPDSIQEFLPPGGSRILDSK